MAALAGSLAEEEVAAEPGRPPPGTTFGMEAVAVDRSIPSRLTGRGRSRSSAGAAVPIRPDDGRHRQASSAADAASWPCRAAGSPPRTSACSPRSPPSWPPPSRPGGCRPRPPTGRGRWPRPTTCGPRLLQAVSHDLRTPLASIKASVSSLRQRDVEWSPEDVDEFHATIEDEADRLNALVANLLDMSRLQAGVLSVQLRAVGLDEVVPAALASLGPSASSASTSTSPRPCRRVDRRPGAARAGARQPGRQRHRPPRPPTGPSRVEAGAVGDQVDLRVDRPGPRHPAADRERVFQPFQRLGDHGTGVGLGLAVARGFVEAMDGELAIDDTPGGGVTMVISLPVAA